MGNRKIAPTKKFGIDEGIAEFINRVKDDDEFKEKLDYIKEKKLQLETFIQSGKTPVLEPVNRLVILRKFNSYTPALPSGSEQYSNKGGGYFLRIGDIGIVIDPGYNFLDNFLSAGYKLDDIDHIFISHAHNDHTVELESIFSLLFKRNKSATISHKIKLYINLGGFKKFSGYFDLSTKKSKDYLDYITLLNKHQLIKLSDTIEVFTTQAKHHEMITCDYALGFIFRITNVDNEKRVIKFTCDSGWSTENETKNSEEGRLFDLEKVDILVAHIGSIKEMEMDYDISKTLIENEQMGNLYEHHLGLIGCAAGTYYWKPEIVLLSEFGEELDAVRHRITKYLRDILKVKIIPTDINFVFNIDNLKVKCMKCKEFYDIEEVEIYHHNGQLYPIYSARLTPFEKQDSNLWLNSISIFE
ncbi:MAG: MBL fold metallo-hydrolase [Desulfobacterales bacterium]|nr:MBL fold metallo-hydrolase [Desulfobacterales bacterium]